MTDSNNSPLMGKGGVQYVIDLNSPAKDSQEVYRMKKQNLPVDFAGRVLKLEMQIEKGINHMTTDDV